ncbi:MAG: hypothetical protein M3O62_18965 [Pseudomonadota bacterium]|nr:hypothetical protein [Pseudomonadota bacterium]
MNHKTLLVCLAIGLPFPALSADEATCAAFVSVIEANLKEEALARTLSVTSPDPATVASNRQTAASTMQIVDQNLRLLAQNGCGTYPRPVDSSGYNSDAMYCAYEILQQRPATSACDRRAWTLKGPIETWHSFGGKPRGSD